MNIGTVIIALRERGAAVLTDLSELPSDRLSEIMAELISLLDQERRIITALENLQATVEWKVDDLIIETATESVS